MIEPFVSAEVVATHLDKSVITVCALARNGVIPGIKLGRDWRFKLSEVDAFLSRPKSLQSPQSRGRKRK